MTDNNQQKVSFKISPRTMRMLGRQNVSNQHVAIIELIKNAYDADATQVSVTFAKDERGDPNIVIQDNGSGMDEQTIINHWLTIATNYKEREPLSSAGRVRTGAKGIGRFALDRLGKVGIIETFISTTAPGLRLLIDWSKYDDILNSFESITHDLETIPNSNQTQGTTITILTLHDQWTERDYIALHDDLVFLIPPINDYHFNFSISLQIDQYSRLSGSIEPLARAIAEYELTSSLSEDGIIRHELRHRSGDLSSKVLYWRDLVPNLFELEPSCGPVKATILFYLRDSVEVKLFDYTITDLRRYLNTFRGIRLYRDGFHIKPYGSKGDDWLGLDGRKERSPEGVGQALGRYHVSNNQLVGTVEVSRTQNPQLQDKTSREGLIENEAFNDLKTFIMSGLRFLEIERQIRAQGIESPLEEPFQEKVQSILTAIERLESAQNEIQVESYALSITDPSRADITITNIDLTKSPSIETQDEEPITTSNQDVEDTETSKLFKVSEKQALLNTVVTELVQQKQSFQKAAQLQLQETQLLRALASLGIALAAFAHEIMRDIHSILDETYLLRDRIETIFPEADSEVKQRIDYAINSAKHMESWSHFILERVKKNRREEQDIKIEEVVSNIMSSFESLFEYLSIKVEIDIEKNIPAFRAFPIDIEAILINLLTNAVKAVQMVSLTQRRIRLQAKYNPTAQQMEVIFEDSGPGVNKQDLPDPKSGLNQLLEPFVSGKNKDGTGMGLAVINKILKDHNGAINIQAHGALGGACFSISIPLKLVED